MPLVGDEAQAPLLSPGSRRRLTLAALSQQQAFEPLAFELGTKVPHAQLEMASPGRMGVIFGTVRAFVACSKS